MKRRSLITLLGGTGIAWPLAAHPQQGPPMRIGVLVGFAEDDPEAKERLRDSGRGFKV